MAVPPIELQVTAINFDKANQSVLETLRLTEEGLDAGDIQLYDFRKAQNELVLACSEVAQEEAGETATIEDPRAWVPIARNLFKYMHYQYKQARVHEDMVLLSERHESARSNQVLMYMEAVEARANQPQIDAYLSLLWLSGKALDQE
jgi:hypothetical protein